MDALREPVTQADRTRARSFARRIATLTACAGILLAAICPHASLAVAQEPPRWVITSVSEPTNFAPGGNGTLVLTAANVGGSPTTGETVTIEDSLPVGLTAAEASGFDSYSGGSTTGNRLSCPSSVGSTVSCTYTGAVDAGDTLVVRIATNVAGSGLPSSVVNHATVSGGGPATASAITPLRISSSPAAFGLAPGSVVTAMSSSRAGAHVDVTTGFGINTSEPGEGSGGLKDVRANFPSGLVGSAVRLPRCPMANVAVNLPNREPINCASDTIVGMATVTVGTPNAYTFVTPVYNIAPSPGEPVAFAFNSLFVPVRLDTSVLSDGDNSVRVTAPDISEAAKVLAAWITIWGVPADHNGPGPNKSLLDELIGEAQAGATFGGRSSATTRAALLTSPTQCSDTLTAGLEADSWEAPNAFSGESSSMGSLSDCGLLQFGSSMSMLPDTLEAGVPAGYTFKLAVPQSDEPDDLATPNVKRVVTTLPMGTVISPSSAWGLQACSEAQFFGPGRGAQQAASPGSCPRESQVGTVRIKTPALEEALVGQVFLAQPLCDPCTPGDAQDGKMVRLFVQVVGEGESGIVVKLAGRGSIDQQTGQLTVTFDQNPQLPFDELQLTLGGGPRATLANPRGCGPATTGVDLTPWSAPFTSDSTPSYTFQINQNCFGPQFAPSFIAGATNIQAGQYTPFTLSFGRQDPDEFLNGLQLQMPPGLLGSLAHVPLCREPQAAQGTCGAESLIGHVQVLTGPGATPFLVTGGQVFLTESYKGAPFGLSIVVPANAGPYTLSGTTGKGTVVVRSTINVDPSDAHLIVTSDPLPTRLDGIPLQLKAVNVTIDRPGFTFNPTNCAKMAINGTLSSAEGASSAVSSPFQVTNCQSLPFKPQFKVSTTARTSRATGASLDAKVIYPSGNAANIARVKVELPKQIPSRLTTLQQACVAAVFAANPANCPAASVIGIARTSTPILPVPLTGPAYFVSHGGEAFPSLVIVLQGDGVRVDLVGTTFISKAGITSTTFKTVPDVPISSFELYLPQGRYSALAANANLCKSKLVMPTEILAQNGAVIHQQTKINVTGCPKTKARHKKKARKARHRRAHRQRAGH